MTSALNLGPPSHMGRYEVLFRIAAGGMAEVFAARVSGEAGFEKLVAVKRMLPTLADDEEFVTMFLDEARLAANISSPHVVQTLDLGRDKDGALFIAMDLVVGVTLSRILKEASKVRRAVPCAMAVELLAQAGEGLHAAHLATTPVGQPLHIIHRDVSPQNILVGIDGRARLTDFGVARAVLRSTKTDAGRIKGKFAYCSPEQLKLEDIDQRADIFSLGVVAWESLAGQRLFAADHPLATMERVTAMPIIPVHQIRSRVPESVANVVQRALERDPANRPATALAFSQDLRAAAVQAGLKLPTRAEVAQFVKAAGGEALHKMRRNIHNAMQLDTSSEFVLEDAAAAEMISSTGTNDTDVIRSDVDYSGVGRIPGSLLPGVLVPNRPKTSTIPWKRIAAGMAISLFVVGALLLFFDSSSSVEVTSLPPLASEPAAPPSPNVANPVAVGEVGEVADSEGSDGIAAGETLADAPPVDEPEVEPDDEAARRRRQRIRRQRLAAMRAHAETMSVMTQTAMTTAMTTMTPTRMTAPVMTEMAPTRMGPLEGIDAFDRALGN